MNTRRTRNEVHSRSGCIHIIPIVSHGGGKRNHYVSSEVILVKRCDGIVTTMKVIRMLNGYTQRDLARLARTNVSYVNYVERGKMLVDEVFGGRIADALGTPTDMLFDHSGFAIQHSVGEEVSA